MRSKLQPFVPALSVLAGLLAVLFVTAVMIGQVSDRSRFAGSELRREVMDRWGAPILQAAPSVRWVESGSVFKTLRPLALDEQRVRLEADMSYRKRGLVEFSGFDFAFEGRYAVTNPEPRDVDLAFVFPIDLQANKVLLSDLRFEVDGAPADASLGDSHDRLTWTGRLRPGDRLDVLIAFRGRGLESFVYWPDPTLPVRNLVMDVVVRGGEEHDYPDGVIAASSVERGKDTVELRWDHPSLESGVPVGLILPSVRSADELILTIERRAWAGWLLLGCTLAALGASTGPRLALMEMLLAAAGFGSFLVLLPYLTAYMPFLAALAMSLTAATALLHWYLVRLVPSAPHGAIGWVLCASLVVPTLAVVAVGYTGLIYTLEIVALVVVLMALTLRGVLGRFAGATRSPEASHAS